MTSKERQRISWLMRLTSLIQKAGGFSFSPV